MMNILRRHKKRRAEQANEEDRERLLEVNPVNKYKHVKTTVSAVRDSYDLLPSISNQDGKFIKLVMKGNSSGAYDLLLRHPDLNINCQNKDGSTPLKCAIMNDDVKMVKLLLRDPKIQIHDEGLDAIKQGNIEMVERLMNKLKELNAEFLPVVGSSEFMEYVTPLILAAQCNNYQIVKSLLRRGHTIEKPHTTTCFCEEICEKRLKGEDLKDSTGRITIYEALIQPAYIFNNSSDPILTAFELSKELSHYAYVEKEFKAQYLKLSKQCSALPVEILDQCRTSEEAESLLKVKDGCDTSREKMIRYPRLGLAVQYGQKKFVAHPSVQHTLRTAWLADWQDWRKLTNIGKMIRVVPIILFLPIIAVVYIICPDMKYVRQLRTPINKFLVSSASYILFLILLFAMNQVQLGEHHRGSPKTNLKYLIMIYIAGLLLQEVQECCVSGRKRHFSNMWNWYDSLMLLLFIITFIMWIVSDVDCMGKDEEYRLQKRLYWSSNDPTLISESLLACACVLAFGRVLYILQISQDLGPLQVTFSRMFHDIFLFLTLFLIVLASFTLGMGKFYEYYNGSTRIDPNGRKFYQAGSFVGYQASMKTFFWSIFGMSPVESGDVIIDNDFGKLEINKHLFTESVGYVLYSIYSVIVVIVMLNLLIAMMSTSYQHVYDNQDEEWKVVRTTVWLSYFDEVSTLPPPFNLIPTSKAIFKLFSRCRRIEKQNMEEDSEENEHMNTLIQRYLNKKDQ